MTLPSQIRPRDGQHHRHYRRGHGCIDHIEKHFRLDRKGGEPDDSFSLGPAEVTSLKTAWRALGKVDYGRKSSEQGGAKFRRSLCFVTELLASQPITQSDVRSVRPGNGMAPQAAQLGDRKYGDSGCTKKYAGLATPVGRSGLRHCPVVILIIGGS